MIGYGVNRYKLLFIVINSKKIFLFFSGIIPIACDELFHQMQNTTDSSTVRIY
jgi:hypothetical protein